DEKNKKENDKNIRDMKMWILGLLSFLYGLPIDNLKVYNHRHYQFYLVQHL
ncbi:DUF2951 family protein, partial [Staphylococcus aureus]